jgi:hypothetical protein
VEVQIQQGLTPTEQETILMPWEAMHSVETQKEYLRKSRFFLEFAGIVDPRLMHHKSGVNRMVIPREREELQRGMREFILKAQGDSQWAKGKVISFIRLQKERLDRKEVGPWHVKNTLKPIKLALEQNDVELSWKKIAHLIPSGQRKSSDREYRLEEIQRLLAVCSLHLKVAVLFMASSGIRIGAFDFLNVGNVEPVLIDGVIVCGKLVVYAGEGDDQYEP